MWLSRLWLTACLCVSSTLARDWAVTIPGGVSVAERVAADHGLINLGEVVPETNIFHFRDQQSGRRRAKRSVEFVTSQLVDHQHVSDVAHQSEPLVRTKRMPLPDQDPDLFVRQTKELCFVNTVATEKSEPRRCIFPFSYRGKSYVTCTADHSTNGREWCATEVRPDGEVIVGQWGDCDKESLSCFTIGPKGEQQVTRPQRPQRPQRPLPRPPTRNGLRRVEQPFPPRRGPRPPPPFAISPGRRPNLPPGYPVDEGFPPPQYPGPNGYAYPPSREGFPPVQGPPLRQPPFRPGQLPPFRQGQLPQLVENNIDEGEDAAPVDLSLFKTYLNDQSWPKMWFLNRGEDGMDMDVEDAWAQGYTGKNVKVTILDDGIEHTHEDLKKNYDPEASIDLNEDDRDPFPRYDLFNSNKHGTRCAGTVAAAANNSNCAVGIAYDAKIGGVRILDGQILDILEARALSFNRDYIDIISASWGPDDNGRTVDGPGELARMALRDGALKGRKGKGNIFVWASGNGGKYFDSCSADGYATSIYTLSISSASENGLIPWYSESCSSTMATTYSSGSKKLKERKVVTTDLHNKCTDQHTGTSASSPMAAGIVALMLEANPDLTWRDVQHITVRSARPQGNLKANDWSTNGVGLKFSHAFGFGLMDAGKMTRMSKDWETVPTQKKCTTPEMILPEPVIIKPKSEELIPLDAELCKTIKYIEHLHLHIDMKTSAKRGDFTVLLKSPAGTVSTLLAPRPFDDVRTGLERFKDWPMMSVHFWGESVVLNGSSKWFLNVRNGGDRAAVVSDFQITFYGTKKDPQPKKPIKLSLFPNEEDKEKQDVENVVNDPNLFTTSVKFDIDEDFDTVLQEENVKDNLQKEENEEKVDVKSSDLLQSSTETDTIEETTTNEAFQEETSPSGDESTIINLHIDMIPEGEDDSDDNVDEAVVGDETTTSGSPKETTTISEPDDSDEMKDTIADAEEAIQVLTEGKSNVPEDQTSSENPGPEETTPISQLSSSSTESNDSS